LWAAAAACWSRVEGKGRLEIERQGRFGTCKTLLYSPFGTREFCLNA
jgi:hypothetical protein